MPTASVKALRPESRSGFRVVLAQEWVRERFWVVPTALLVAGMAVGVAVSRADSIPGVDKVGGGLPVRAGSAEALLGIIAASMLTFVGVVFTITLVALQLASAQLSPRVIRTFVRSGITKLAFGLFLATFAYAIVVLVVEGASSSASVLRLAVTLGVLFVLASLVVFVVYVTATMRLLQVSWVVTAVADETRRVLRSGATSGGKLSVGRGSGGGSGPTTHTAETGAGRRQGRPVRRDSRGRPWAIGTVRPAVRLLAAVPAKGGRVCPDRRCAGGGPRWKRPVRRRSSRLCPPRSITHDVPGSAIRNPPTRRCCQPGAVTGVQPADHSRDRHRPHRRVVAADRPAASAHRFVCGYRRCRTTHASRAHMGRNCRPGIHRDRYLWGAIAALSSDGWPLHTSVCNSRSPSICALTVARHMALLEPLASEAILPQHPMATPTRIHEGLAEDAALRTDSRQPPPPEPPSNPVVLDRAGCLHPGPVTA